MIDLTQVSDADLTHEYMRRFNAKYGGNGGRSKQLRPCKFCGAEFGGREMRKHIVVCKQNIIATYTNKATKAARSKTHAKTQTVTR
jgi:hypothetical protein